MSKKNLVIVESPAKAKTIEKYLGSDFQVLSSIGHIRSIAKKTKDGTPPIDTKNGFTTVYEVDPEKRKTITELKKAVKAAETVWLATDEDREGEAIAWHLCEVLKLDPRTTKRIVFHEITKSAIEEAVKNPRTIDMRLVQAQQARQILDRLVGFELSPVVWQKVPGGKSAGRVQSPAVRLLVEREREIEAFQGSYTFKVSAVFTHDGEEVKAELPHRFATEDEAYAFLESLAGAHFVVSDVSTSPLTRNPPAPFTTSTLQQDANAKLGFGAKATMASAQKLYQDGKITYMRTDSVNLSGQAIASAKDFIVSTWGEQYSHIRTYKTKSANAQEAHEAIRPTDMRTEKASSNEYDQKLYQLIRNRTLASQMAAAKLEKTTITISITPSASETGKPSLSAGYVFEAKGEVVIFDGFLKVYGANKKEVELLPRVATGDQLDLASAQARQTFARPPARYSEGSLVKKLEDLGIGRPSTYATIIGTIQDRGYAVKGEGEGTPREVVVLELRDKKQEIGDTSHTAPADVSAASAAEGSAFPAERGKTNDQLAPSASSAADGSRNVGFVHRTIVQEKTGADRGKLVPTPSGEVVSDFLTGHFDQIVDYGFTAEVEKEFDQIARGDMARNDMLGEFYTPFHTLIEQSGGIDRSTVSQARTIGTDPRSGKLVLARFGRFGPMLQLGEAVEGGEKPQFAPMPAGKKIDTVTLDEALHAFTLPRVVGQTPEGDVVKANIGRFGPYVQIGKLFVSIKPLDPHTITLDEALALYADKLKAEAEKNIADFGTIKVLRGRYGPYVTDGTKNAKIPKDTDPTTLTEADAAALLAAAPAASKRRPIRRKKT